MVLTTLSKGIWRISNNSNKDQDLERGGSFFHHLFQTVGLLIDILDKIDDFYKSLQSFSRIIQNPKNEYWISLRPDQVIIFDNYRLLHGRSAINGKRTLVTCYISQDEFRLKLSKLNKI